MENKRVFEVKTLEEAIILRKTLITKLRCYATLSVIVHKNTSSLSDEIIVHSLGMLPFVTVDETFENPQPNFSIKMKNLTERIIDVTSTYIRGDFKTCKPIRDVIICRLEPEEEIDLGIIVSIGDGTMNAKWSHVSLVGFEEKDDKIFVSVETNGTLSATKAVNRALEIINETEEIVKILS